MGARILFAEMLLSFIILSKIVIRSEKMVDYTEYKVGQSRQNDHLLNPFLRKLKPRISAKDKLKPRISLNQG